MREWTYQIQDRQGLHARPAAMLAVQAGACESRVTLMKDGRYADASDVMAVMGLRIMFEDMVTIRIEGGNEEMNLQKIADFFCENL